MPRSRSRSIRSRYCARMSRSATAWVSSSRRSASVDLPWSMCATMQKFRMWDTSIGVHATGGCGPAPSGKPAAVRYVALACDYDGTLAADGAVSDRAVAAVERVRESGRATLLVTGRELDDLARAFDRLDLFDRIVAENGAVLMDPAT